MSTDVSFTFCYSWRHFFIRNMLWTLLVSFSILITIIIFTESLNHQGSQVSLRILVLFFSIFFFCFPYRDQVQKGLLHHISVELLLTGIQQSPLSWTEVHSHILKGHRLPVAVFRRTRRGHQISLQVVSHHVVAGI